MNPDTRRKCRHLYGNLSRHTATLLAVVLFVLPGFFMLAHAQQSSSYAVALQSKRGELQTQLRNNSFKEPLYLISQEEKQRVGGDIYADIPNSFTDVTAAFKSASTVCQLVILHLNVRSCSPSGSKGNESVNMALGPKRAMTSGELYRISYSLHIEAAEASYFRASMRAPKGPLGTRDYSIVFEAMPIGAKQSFVHFGYAYGYGTMAKMAMDLYLSTAGRNKIGFTVIGQSPDGKPLYVGGERGSLERNVMRYYLALLAYSSVDTGTPEEMMHARMRKWFALTERYPAQLHELELKEYLDEKRGQLAKSGSAR